MGRSAGGPREAANLAGRAGERGEERGRVVRTGRNTLVAIRAGATLCATVGGVACYLGLVQLQVNSAVAALVGLGFAVLARLAMTSLAREWLLARARARTQRTSGSGAPRGRS